MDLFERFADLLKKFESVVGWRVVGDVDQSDDGLREFVGLVQCVQQFVSGAEIWSFLRLTE